MEEENKITEAEVEKIEKIEEEKNKKMDVYIEFALIFILGILIGIALKTEANRRITIGFDDYQMKLAKQDFNINQLQFEVAKKSADNFAKTDNKNPQQDDSAVPSDDASGNQN